MEPPGGAPPNSPLRLLLDDDGATARLGAALAKALANRVGGVVFLHGSLGAGKTTLARGWLRSLGVTGTIRSPTYTLVEPYRIDGRDLLHLDLYRIESAEELDGLGLDDTPPNSAWWLVEWPERGAGRLPAADLEITLAVEGSGRTATIESANWQVSIAEALGNFL